MAENMNIQHYEWRNIPLNLAIWLCAKINRKAHRNEGQFIQTKLFKVLVMFWFESFAKLGGD